ncbi:MAG: AAA family ATPase [Rhizobiaceae bacterium]|nr:AAA family ATPase [Rhizobiaceae bacterium]
MTSQSMPNPDIHVLEQLLAIGRRRWFVVAALSLVGLVLGSVFALSRVPVYSTSATVMVRSGPAVDPLRQGIETSTPEEEGQFLSQLELARSASVARMVADRLELAEDEAFARPGKSRLAEVVARVTGRSRSPAETLSDEAVAARLAAGVKVLRVGRTYVAAISYTHPDPVVARKVAQAFAEAFRQKIAQENDLANSRLRAALQSEIDRATGSEKEMLQARLREAMLSRALPGLDVVILSDARLPAAPSAPRTAFMAAVGLILGAVAGCALAGLRELTDRGVRDGDQLSRRTGIRFLGYLPRRAPASGPQVTIGRDALPDAARHVVIEPYSAFGETIRAVGVTVNAAPAERDSKGRVTALTAVMPGENTMIPAANLAAHLASLGRSVVLVDADGREARLSRWLAADARQGIVEALLQDKPLDECILNDSRTNVSLLPMVTAGDRMVEPSALFSSDRARAFFRTLASQYDHVILDLAPLSTAADARAASPLVDAFILTVPWGKATPQLVVDLLDAEPEIRSGLAGFVLTSTDFRKLSRYADAGSRADFQKRFSRG